ncbi:MAG: SDR family oxidoreductase [Alphaproteobacteria bacterium]|nr:SDR family oxidoreductase [Alphaproteobacteria bacterium]
MTGRSALVTGGARRIGRAIALTLAAHGWDIAIHYGGSRDDAETLADEIRQHDRRAAALAADLAREDEVAELMPRAAEAVGPLALLINNASVFERDDALTVTRASWDRHLETNLRAPFVLMQGFARQLPDGTDGAVVNILDERVWNLTPYFVSYTVSKTGLWTLTQTMALALAPRIRVNGIGPGPTLPSPRQSEEQFRRQVELLPLRRGTTPDEIARAVMFILESPAMTGQMIVLDGGQHLNWAPTTSRVPPASE